MKVERGLSGGRMFSKREGGQESVMGCIWSKYIVYMYENVIKRPSILCTLLYGKNSVI
jgi:hypothetical protein